MTRLFDLAEWVGDRTVNVLLVGETGVGKAVVAEAIHRASARVSRPFVRVDCAVLSPTLSDDDLFGHDEGASTGAEQPWLELLEAANGGTVFLDAVGELPLTLQARLLRVLEARTIKRLADRRPLDVRVIAATRRDLGVDVERGAFRADVYFWLSGITLVVPPLRQRAVEIAPLADWFLAHARPPHPPALSPEARDLLERYAWPGNVRELRYVIERAARWCGTGPITPAHLPPEIANLCPPSVAGPPPSPRTIAPPLAPQPLPRPPAREPGVSMLPPASDTGAWLVHHKGDWFRPPSGQTVECRRRKALRRLLMCLVEQRLATPDQPLSTDALIAAGWPGIQARHDSSMNRLWVSLARLRELGLRKLLLCDDGGYLLDPRVPIQIVQELPAAPAPCANSP